MELHALTQAARSYALLLPAIGQLVSWSTNPGIAVENVLALCLQLMGEQGHECEELSSREGE